MADKAPSGESVKAAGIPSEIVWHRCPQHQVLFNPRIGCVACKTGSDLKLRGEHFEIDEPRELVIGPNAAAER
jgi:hypothetical protein